MHFTFVVPLPVITEGFLAFVSYFLQCKAKAGNQSVFPGQYCLDCMRFLDCYYKANFIVIFNVLDLNILKCYLKTYLWEARWPNG